SGVLDLRGCARTAAALARALQNWLCTVFCGRRLSFSLGGHRSGNGFVPLFFVANGTTARNGIAAGAPACQRDTIHCLFLSFELHTGNCRSLHFGEMWAAPWLEARPKMGSFSVGWL